MFRRPRVAITSLAISIARVMAGSPANIAIMAMVSAISSSVAPGAQRWRTVSLIWASACAPCMSARQRQEKPGLGVQPVFVQSLAERASIISLDMVGHIASNPLGENVQARRMAFAISCACPSSFERVFDVIGRVHPSPGCGQSQLPSGHRSQAAWSCHRKALRGSRWQTRKFGPFDNGVHRACLLAETAVDAFGHVNIVARGAARAVIARLGINGNRLRGADRFAKLAGNAAFFAIGIAAQRVFATETRATAAPFHAGSSASLWGEEILQAQAQALPEIHQQEVFDRAGVVDLGHDWPPSEFA